MNHKNKEGAHFRQSYQASQMLDSGRRVQEFAMDTPTERPAARKEFASYRWQKHCRGLYQTPIAA
jgi:hypothetical protein